MNLDANLTALTPPNEAGVSLRNPGPAMPPSLEALNTSVGRILNELTDKDSRVEDVLSGSDCSSLARTASDALLASETKSYCENSGSPGSFDRLKGATLAAVEAIGNGAFTKGPLSDDKPLIPVGSIQVAIINLKLVLQELQSKATPGRYDGYEGCVRGI